MERVASWAGRDPSTERVGFGDVLEDSILHRRFRRFSKRGCTKAPRAAVQIHIFDN